MLDWSEPSAPARQAPPAFVTTPVAVADQTGLGTIDRRGVAEANEEVSHAGVGDARCRFRNDILGSKSQSGSQRRQIGQRGSQLERRLLHTAKDAPIHLTEFDRQNFAGDFLPEGARNFDGPELAFLGQPKPGAECVVTGATHFRARGGEGPKFEISPIAAHDEGCFGLIEFAGDPAHLGLGQIVRTFDDCQRVAAERAIREDIDKAGDQGCIARLRDHGVTPILLVEIECAPVRRRLKTRIACPTDKGN